MNLRPVTSWAGLAALTTATLLFQTGIPAMANADGGSVTGRVVWCAAAPVPLGASVPGVAGGGAGSVSPGVPVPGGAGGGVGSAPPGISVQPAPMPPAPSGITIAPQGPNQAPDQQGPVTGIAIPNQPGPGG